MKNERVSSEYEQEGLYLSKDNIGGQRSKIDVLATMLHICLNGSLKNHIIGKGNFSDAMANHYISILLYNDLLQTTKDENSRICYHSTEKGKMLIRNYNAIQQLFSKDNSGNKGKVEDRPEIEEIRNILVVDDDLDIGNALKAGLEQYGFNVSLHDDPLSMLSSYKSGQYNLLVLDIHMPKLNGFELYKLIKKIDDKAMVCFLTAFEEYSDEFKTEFPDMDMKYFIRKPIPMKELIERITSIAKEHKEVH